MKILSKKELSRIISYANIGYKQGFLDGMKFEKDEISEETLDRLIDENSNRIQKNMEKAVCAE